MMGCIIQLQIILINWNLGVVALSCFVYGYAYGTLTERRDGGRGGVARDRGDAEGETKSRHEKRRVKSG